MPREEPVPFATTEGELGVETSGEDVSSSALRSTFCFAFATAWFKSPPKLFFANKADSLGACDEGLKVDDEVLLAGGETTGRAGVAARFLVGLRLDSGKAAPGTLKGCTVLLVGTGTGMVETVVDALAGAGRGAGLAVGIVPASAGRLAISSWSRGRPQSRAAWS